MKVALVHDWLTGMRGGENVLEIFCEMFPQADLYTLIHVKGSVSKTIEGRSVHSSFLQRFPGVEKKYRWFLPLMPSAIESFRLEGYDLVLSSSHCVAKGINPGGAPHLCYCFTPMRYAWEMYGEYFNRRRFSPLTLAGIGAVMPYLRRWDVGTSSRVDRFIAISNHVRERIKRQYGRDADVIYPPVDVDFYTPGGEVGKEGYVVISAFAPYKRVDLAVEAFNRMGKELHIVGGGEDDGRLRGMAGPSITFEGGASRERLRELYRKSSALIFPGEEDFGIVPVEAMACGTPVIAYGKGGATETVIPLGAQNPTGVFFENQTVEGLMEAVRRFEAERSVFHPDALRKNAERFSKAVFVDRMATAVKNFLEPQGGRRTGRGDGEGRPSAVK